MGLADYLTGAFYFGATAGLTMAAGAVIVRRRLPDLGGAVSVIAVGLVWTALIVAVHVVPLTLGILSRPSVLVCAALSTLLSAFLPRGRSAGTAGAPAASPPPNGRVSWAIAAATVGFVAIATVINVRSQWAVPTTSVDMVSFHLPGVARWIQRGSLWHIDQFAPDLAQGNYPNNGNVVLLAAVLPWKSDFLTRLVFVPFLAMTGLSVYALARELAAPTAVAASFGALAVSLPNAASDVLTGSNVDAVMLFTFVAGVLFLLRHRRTRSRGDLFLAGAGLGLALGTKWFGLSSAIVVFVVWAAASLVDGRDPPRRVAVQAAQMAGLITAFGGIWLVRNLVESGDPFFPVRVAPFGITLFDAPPDGFRHRYGFSIAHYATDGHVWSKYLLPAFRTTLGAPGLVIAAGALGAAILGLARRRPAFPGDRRAVLGVSVLAALLLAVYLTTPYTAWGPAGAPFLTISTTRYAAPFMLVAAGLAATAAGSLGRLRPVAQLVVLAAAIAGLHRADFRLASAVVATLALGIAATIVATAARRSPRAHDLLRRLPSTVSRPAAPAAGLAVLAVVVAAGAYGWREQRTYHHRLLSQRTKPVGLVLTYAPSGHRVGLASTWPAASAPVRFMFGPRLGNRVAYVGPIVDGMLRQYRSARAFRAALCAGRYDLLLVGHGIPPRPHVREQDWARAAGFAPVADDGRLVLFKAPKRRCR